MVVPRLGLSSVEEYYTLTNGLSLLPQLDKPTLILYAADDPLFDPALVAEIQTTCAANPMIDLRLTEQGGHVGYVSSAACQRQIQDPDRWWAWNRMLDWCDRASPANQSVNPDINLSRPCLIQISCSRGQQYLPALVAALVLQLRIKAQAKSGKY